MNQKSKLSHFPAAPPSFNLPATDRDRKIEKVRAYREPIKSQMTNNGVLNSWKEIASYLGRGVRTVQRWEQELDLPVRRPRGKHRSAVIALQEDLDHWLRTPHGAQAQSQQNHHSACRENHVRLVHNAEILISRTSVLIARSDALQKQAARAISIGAALRTSCKAAKDDRKNGRSV